MYPFQTVHTTFPFQRWMTLILGFCLVFFAFCRSAHAQIDGFTEPFRKIELASDESGSISELLVVESQQVREGQPIARLDTRVQEIQVEIAKQLEQTTSQLVMAEEEFRKRQTITAKIIELNENGHANRSEVYRAQMELSIAKSKYLSAKEEKVVRELERIRAQIQLDRRTIKAPFDGVIAKIHTRAGEFLSPARPEVVTLVQIDRLIATFAVPSSKITSFEIGQQYNIASGDGRTILATVSSIGVETDAQSGTVEVKLVIENPMHEYRSGEICTLNI